MESSSYALALISVLVGLALTDIAVSLHKLLRRGRRVRWDARVALAAAFVTVLAIEMWFQSQRLSRTAEAGDFLFFLSLFVEYGLLVMAACAVLPDEVGDAVDLAAFYDAERRYVWGTIVAFEISHLLHASYLMPKRLLAGSAADWAMFLGPVLLYASLLTVRNKGFHVVVIALALTAIIVRAQLR